MGEGKALARRHTLIRIAITGTTLLWAATIAAAVSEIGSDRLFMTLRAGAVIAAVATVALLSLVFVKAQVDRIERDLNNAVLQAADELDKAVGAAGDVLRMDRSAVEVARRLLAAELVDVGRD
jgi:predicted DNA repair protein MutK